MAELGPSARELHREIGEYARGRCDRLFAVGALAPKPPRRSACRDGVADIDAARATLEPLLAATSRS